MSNNNSCKLCRLNKADKTGSHFLPHFLLKRIDNIDGSTARDKELGFLIGERDTTSYIGRAVLPEQFEEVFGELSEEEAKAMKNPSVEDYVFCKDCETKFSAIEGEYSKTIGYYNGESEYVNKILKELAFLFWVSVLWRVSISKKYGLILIEGEEELLRSFLINHLKEKVSDINIAQIEGDQQGMKLAYRLIRCPQYPDPTFLLCHWKHTNPYTILIDEYVLFFYFNSDMIDKTKQDFFGFENYLNKPSTNTLKQGERIMPIKESEFKNCLWNLAIYLADARLKHYNWLFDEIYKKLQGTLMPEDLKKAILNEIMSEEKKLGRKYTYDDLCKTMYQEIKKYQG
jgi:hypothetical protein